jgi:uncharacterized protein (DUF305 family)
VSHAEPPECTDNPKSGTRLAAVRRPGKLAVEMEHPPQARNYRALAGMALLSFFAMYALMYAMVDRLGNVYNNLNQLYMAALMTMPMVVIELGLMRAMYGNARLNAAVVAACVVIGVASWLGIREQALVSNSQFLRSMIPHHGGAVLMCEQAVLTDWELLALCDQIIRSQNTEIALMKDSLARISSGNAVHAASAGGTPPEPRKATAGAP